MHRYDANGMLLHNPQWGRPATNGINELFFEAVIDATQLVPVSCKNHFCIITQFVLYNRLSPRLGASGGLSAKLSKRIFGSYPTPTRSKYPPNW